MTDLEIEREDSASRAQAVPRSGRSVELVPVGPEHTEFLYRLSIDETVGWRWRYAGTVPRRDLFEQSLWTGVLTQFIIRERKLGGVMGSAFAYNADLNHGYAFVAIGMLPEATRSGIGIEATDLFVGHLFACYRIRKLYFDVPEFNIVQFNSAVGSLLHEEGRLLKHTYYNGRYWDRMTFALYREDYDNLSQSGRILGRRRRARQLDASDSSGNNT